MSLGILPEVYDGATMTRASLEARRVMGTEPVRSDRSLADVSWKPEVTQAAVGQWKQVGKAEAKPALQAKPHSGRPPKLNSVAIGKADTYHESRAYGAKLEAVWTLLNPRLRLNDLGNRFFQSTDASCSRR
jgi:hypothetical protein